METLKIKTIQTSTHFDTEDGVVRIGASIELENGITLDCQSDVARPFLATALLNPDWVIKNVKAVMFHKEMVGLFYTETGRVVNGFESQASQPHLFIPTLFYFT